MTEERYDKMVAEMKAAGFVVEHYPGMGKAFATRNNEFIESKNILGVYRKFRNLNTTKK